MLTRAWRAIRGGVGRVMDELVDLIHGPPLGQQLTIEEMPLLTLPHPEVRHERPISARMVTYWPDGTGEWARQCARHDIELLREAILLALKRTHRPTRDALGCPLSAPEFGRYRKAQTGEDSG